MGDYHKLGYAVLRQFIGRDTIDKMNSVIDKLSTELKPCETVFDESGTGKIKQIQYLQNYDPVFQSVIDKIRPLVEELTGEKDLNVLNMQLFEKHPFISKHTRAHQDNAYFQLTPATPITVWISLDDIDEENGCIYYAPYTHLTPTRKHQRYHPHTTFRVRSGVPGLSLCLHEHPSETDTAVPTGPGDIILHNCNTVHRAGRNESTDRRRRAIGVVYIPATCTRDERLHGYHLERLAEDIELQKVKNPSIYGKLVAEYK